MILSSSSYYWLALGLKTDYNFNKAIHQSIINICSAVKIQNSKHHTTGHCKARLSQQQEYYCKTQHRLHSHASCPSHEQS